MIYISLLYLPGRVINTHAKGKQAQSKEDKAMTNIFEETYEAMEAARKAYAEATTDEGQNAAEKAYGEAKDRMAAKGEIAWKIWRAYEHSRETENEVLDFNDIIWDRDVEALTTCMKRMASRPSPTPARQPTQSKPYGFSSRPAAPSARWSRSTSGRTSGAKDMKKSTPSR
jgi:hypothetical protein